MLIQLVEGLPSPGHTNLDPCICIRRWVSRQVHWLDGVIAFYRQKQYAMGHDVSFSSIHVSDLPLVLFESASSCLLFVRSK